MRSSKLLDLTKGNVLGLSRCLSQVMFTFFPTPGPVPTLYGDPVKGSMLATCNLRSTEGPIVVTMDRYIQYIGIFIEYSFGPIAVTILAR